jgi:hypothetical protein
LAGCGRQVGFDVHRLERTNDILGHTEAGFGAIGVGSHTLEFTAIDFSLNGFLQFFKINSHYLRSRPINSQYMLMSS